MNPTWTKRSVFRACLPTAQLSGMMHSSHSQPKLDLSSGLAGVSGFLDCVGSAGGRSSGWNTGVWSDVCSYTWVINLLFYCYTAPQRILVLVQHALGSAQPHFSLFCTDAASRSVNCNGASVMQRPSSLPATNDIPTTAKHRWQPFPKDSRWMFHGLIPASSDLLHIFVFTAIWAGMSWSHLISSRALWSCCNYP